MMIAVLIPSLTFAQSYTLTGIVTDDTKAPLAGTTIIKAGTSGEGTITGADGSYELPVAKGDVLTFSFIGYIDQSITISGQSKLDVQMVADATKLDDVVVVGYGRMRKADVTAAITSVDVDELKTVATSDPMAALQGRVSGVNIQKTSGLAGSGVKVKIRGVSTFGSNEPLYIIDGFRGNINSISPTDIESLQILKDGAAAAIYGSEAANGVVIVTTKSGKKGDVVIDFNAYLSYRQISKQLDFLDTKGYQKVQTAMFENDGKTVPEYATDATDVDTNWSDEIFRNGFSQSYGISIIGGSENIKVATGANYSKDLGMTIGNSYTRQDAFVKAQLKKHVFTVDAKLAYNGSNYDAPVYSLTDAYKMAPIVPVYAKHAEGEVVDGSNRYGLSTPYGIGDIKNPIAMHENESSNTKLQGIDASVALTIDFTDWLSFKSGYSYSVKKKKKSYHSGIYTANAKEPKLYPYNSDTRKQWMKQSITESLTFDKKFGKHSLNVMLGFEMNLDDYNVGSVGVEGKKAQEDGSFKPAGFPDPNFTTINAGKGGTFDGSGYYDEHNRISYFGRINYNYDNRYLVQATVRRDASSYFGENNRWGTFPSVAVGWRITQEEFFPSDTPVNELKLRASYGLLGNESGLWPYAYESLMVVTDSYWNGASVLNGQPWQGMSAFAMENKDLKWETTESINVGLDYAFFDNRLNGSFNYYQTTTKDLLIWRPVPASAGVSSPYTNIGKIRNNGIEFEASWAETRGDWDYNVGLIVSTTHNEVLELAKEGQTLIGDQVPAYSGYVPNTTEVGQAIGSFKLYETDGIFQTDDEAKNYEFTDKDGNTSRIQKKAKAGDIKFVDKNNDGKIDGKDKTYQGSGIPKAEVSLSMGFGWKGIDFNALIGSGWGHKLYNGNLAQYGGMADGYNGLTTGLEAWTPENSSTSTPRAVYGDPNGNNRESDRFLENGNFIRLRQVQIGYTLPINVTQKISIDKVRFYVSGENLFTWTNYSGIDPEFSSSLLSSGVDSWIYPFTKSYVFGVQVTF